MRHAIRGFVILVLCCSPLLASSGYLRGVIVEVKNAAGKVVSFVVLQDFEAHGRFGQKDRISFTTTATTAVTFDRKDVEAAEAIQLGRTAFVQIGRGKVVRVDVLDLPKQDILPKPDQIDPNNGALDMTIPIAKGPFGAFKLTVTLRNGKVISAVAKNGNSKFLLDPASFSLEGAQLHAKLSFNMPYAKRSALTPKDRKGMDNPTTLTFSAGLGGVQKASVQADFWGKARTIESEASFRGYRTTPTKGRVVFYIKKDAGYFYDFTFEGTKVTSMARRHHYGRQPKPVDAEVSFDNGMLTGTIEGIEVILAHVDMELHGRWSAGGKTGILTGGFIPEGQPLVTQDVVGMQKK